MIIKDIAKEVHANAIRHGWWDDRPTDCAIFALIHAEWSEALEQFRAGKPMRWHACMDWRNEPCKGEKCADHEICKHIYQKPEGIAVELIDGCLRIMDYMEAERITPEDDVQPITITGAPWEVTKLITKLHGMTTDAYRGAFPDSRLRKILSTVFGWLISMGFDPEELIREKMAYNEKRPYRHGGKVI